MRHGAYDRVSRQLAAHADIRIPGCTNLSSLRRFLRVAYVGRGWGSVPDGCFPRRVPVAPWRCYLASCAVCSKAYRGIGGYCWRTMGGEHGIPLERRRPDHVLGPRL